MVSTPVAVGPLGMAAGPMVAPPARVPLGFMLAGGIGLLGFGGAAWLAADRAVQAYNHPGVLAAVHAGVLAFLTTTVLGAMHQFAPVVGRRPLRSVPVAYVTLASMVAAAWLLPSGFAHGPEGLVAAGGVFGTIAVLLAAWNLSAPLAGRGGGVPLAGLRLSLGYLVVTVGFGVTYAFNRQAGWFPLYSHRVLAHAHLGLLGWLGLTYLAVAEKLWPMFLLSHRPSNRSGAWAVGLVAAGTAVLSTGLLFDARWPITIGAAVVLAGLGAHLTSLAGAVRHRRRRLELLHAYLFVSAGFLVTAAAFGVAAGLASVEVTERARLVVAEVTALIGWLALAVIGHAHKIVPFISYTALRARGVRTNRLGRPLLFGDLFNHRAGQVSLVLGALGFATIIAGVLVDRSEVVALGAACITATGAVTVANLVAGPVRAARIPQTRASTAPTTRETS
jgi:hypothetical protein